MLHYRRTWLGGWRSEAAGPEFFLSPRGRNDPQAELEATLAAFFDPPPPESDPKAQHPQCRFPARYRWLKEELAFDPDRLPEQPCRWFTPWRRSLDAASVSLVFAAAYLYNPSSLYGHTFLRLELPGHGESERLLDYTLNYAAVVSDTNGILFALKGLIGAYPGRYSVMPYYVKVQEYSHLESRDLWEYRLALDPKQIGRLVDHAWELGSTYFPYYFFSKNCSYQLLPLIEVADPERALTPAHPVWVIPADTVRRLVRAGRIAGVRYRPSHLTRMRARRRALNREESVLAAALVERPVQDGLRAAAALPPRRRALVLDAAEDYLLWKGGFSPDAAPEVRGRERALLLARGALDVPAAEPAVPEPAPPERGHQTGRLALGAGSVRGRRFEELSLRAALHDLLDPPAAYDPDQEMEMGHLRLRYDERARKLWAQEATLVRIVSVAPWDPWVRKPSWEVATGVATAQAPGREPWRSQYWDLRAGSGLAAETGLGRRELWYVLAEAAAGAGGVLRDGWRAGGGARAGLTVDLAPAWRARLEGRHLGYFLGDDRPEWVVGLTQHAALGKDLGLRLTLERHRRGAEAALAMLVYL